MEKRLTEFNEGGTHEQNPLGGIPQGTGTNGKPNTVEEGETKFKINGVDYVFSNRLNLKDSYINDHYLPDYIKGKSFAEASKAIEDRFKDRTDNASMSTKEAMYRRLSAAQETERHAQEAADHGMSVEKYDEFLAQQQAAPEAPTNELEDGGLLDNITGNQVAGVLGGAGVLTADAMNNAQGTSKQSVAGAAGKSAIAGASAGAALGPIGAAGGAVIGGIVGGVSAAAGNKKLHNKEMDEHTARNVEESLTENGRAYGGYMMPTNDMHDGGFFHNIFKRHPHDPTDPVRGKKGARGQEGATGKAGRAGKPGRGREVDGFDGGFGGGDFGGAGASGQWNPDRLEPLTGSRAGITPIITPEGDIIPVQPSLDHTEYPIPTEAAGFDFTPTENNDLVFPVQYTNVGETGGASDEDGEDRDLNLGSYLGLGASLAPFIGNLAEGANLSAPERNTLARVGRTYIPEFADERKLTNIVDDSFSGIDDSIANAANGNLGAYRANILGASANKAKARFDAFNQINDINRQERKNLNADFAAASKEHVDKFNIEQDLDKQDRAAYDAAKQAYRVAAYEGLGELGKTIFTLNQADGLTSYDFLTGDKKKNKD